MARYLYHWTHPTALDTIRTGGLDPSYATGQMRVVWMCDGRRVMWACGHVANCHGWEPDALVLLRVRVDGLRLSKVAWPNIRVSRGVIPPERIEVCDTSGPIGCTPIGDV